MSFWAWLSGKKRTLATIYWLVMIPAVAKVWPEGAPVIIDNIVYILGLIMSTLGLGHAAIKQGTAK